VEVSGSFGATLAGFKPAPALRIARRSPVQHRMGTSQLHYRDGSVFGMALRFDGLRMLCGAHS